MSYMWNEFNIKTFPAETIVYRDGKYCPDLSTLENKTIDKKYDLPVHIIYVGEIVDKNELNINIDVEKQPVFLSVDIKNKKPAFLNVFIKNIGKNSELRGHIFVENFDSLELNINAGHLCKNTGILVHTKLTKFSLYPTKTTFCEKFSKIFAEKFGSNKKMRTFAIPNDKNNITVGSYNG